MNSDKKRQKELYEYTTTAHILCLIIFSISIILSDYSLLPNETFYPFADIWFLFLLSFFGAVIVLLYNTKISLLHKRPKDVHLVDLAYIAFPLLITVMTLVVTQRNLPHAEAILLLPIFITASIMGKKPGLIMSTICSIILVFNEIILYPGQTVLQTAEANLILISLMYTVGWFIGGMTDVETKNREYLREMANTDMLTGLYNHRYFQEILKDYLSQGVTDKNPLSLIIIDIDYFKNYNDNFGHLAGDKVLKVFGALLKESVKDAGFAARYGGEEFVVVLPNHDSDKAVQKAKEIKSKINSYPFHGAEHQPGGKITVSCGVAISPTHGTRAKELIKQADNALYRAKSLNKDKVELYFSVLDDLELNKSEKDLLNSIRTLISIINSKDRYTYGHSERVTDYSLNLAQKLSLPEDDIQTLKYAAFLHDIGKIEIEREVLNKPGRLSKQEWFILKQHPKWGSDIVKPIVKLRPIVPIILYHHENYDGSGYPEGLHKEEIPLLARIIRIVDSFDAMTSHRTYKKNMSINEAIAELKRCSGTMFDPELTNLFIDYIMSTNSIGDSY